MQNWTRKSVQWLIFKGVSCPEMQLTNMQGKIAIRIVLYWCNTWYYANKGKNRDPLSYWRKGHVFFLFDCLRGINCLWRFGIVLWSEDTNSNKKNWHYVRIPLRKCCTNKACQRIFLMQICLLTDFFGWILQVVDHLTTCYWILLLKKLL